MAINVNTVYTTVLTILNKEQRGYLTPFEFNNVANQVQLEVFESTANHQLLYLISAANGGQVVYPENLSELPKYIEEKGFAKPILYESIKTRSLIHLKWIFFLILGLLGFEWFLRRFFGSY